MKAIILAAGKWTRLAPFTDTVPKPLIKIMGKSIVEHNLESIYKEVDEIVIVTKYLAEKFPKALWDNYKWTPISYKIQGKEKWTAAALFWFESEVDVVIMNGDAILDTQDLQTLVKHPGYACLVKEVEDPERYGIFRLSEIGNIKEVVEKPDTDIWNLANTWIYKMPGEIFEAIKSIELSPRGEYEITDAINIIAEKFPLKPITVSGYYIDIWFPWNIHDVNSHFLSTLKDSRIDGTVEDEVNINGEVIIESGAVIKSGTYIEWNCYIWKNAVVWPNAYIRWNSYIWEWSKVGFSVELKNSTLWDNTAIPHLSYIWDSIIWNNVNLGGWFKVANLRHDQKNIKVMSKWELIDSWKNKLGAIVWDNVKTWINTLVYPGRVLDTNSYTLPGEIVK